MIVDDSPDDHCIFVKDPNLIEYYETKKEYKLAFIESNQQSNYFELAIEYRKGQVQITQQTPQGPIQIPQEKVMWKVIGQGWK